MTTYFNIFNGNPVQPSQVSYQELTLTQSEELNWTTSGLETPNIVTLIIDLISEDPSYTLMMPDATQVSTGQSVIIRNIGAEDVDIVNQGGLTIATVAAGIAIYLYLTDNTTVNGQWGNVTFGAGTAQADAATLQGLGLIAIGGKLNTNIPPNVLGVVSNYNVTSNDRASLVVWTSGVGTITLPATSVGVGFYLSIHNSSQNGGQVTLVPTGTSVNIDNFNTLQIDPGQSLTVVLVNNTNWYSIGFGQETFYSVNVLSLDVSGNTDTVLTNEQASKLIQIFTGALTGDKNIIYPTVANQYYPYNQTTGSYNLGLSLATGPTIPIAQGQRLIIACDGNDLNSYPSTPTPSNIVFPDGAENSPSVTFEGDTLSGVYLPGVGQVGITIQGSDAFRVTSSGITIFEDGTQLLPSITWNDENTLGFYRYASGAIGFATSSLTPVVIDGLGLAVIDGTQTDPSITFLAQSNKGFYNPGNDLIGISVNASQVAQFGVNGLEVFDGVMTAPSIAFINYQDTGIYTEGANDVSFTCNGTSTASVNPAGITINNGLSLILQETAGTFQTNIKSANLTGDLTFTFPNNYPSTNNLFLVSNTTGDLSFSNSIDSIEILDGGTLAFEESGGSNVITFGAPALSADLNYTLVNAYPTVNGQPMVSTTAGVMSWATSSFDATGIKVPDGATATPSISFTSTTNSGLSYSSGSNILSVSISGNNVFQFSPSGVISRQAFYVLSGPTDNFITGFDGSASASAINLYTLPAAFPTVNGQPMVSTTAGVMSWATSSFDATGIKVPDGAIATPSISFTSTIDAGISYDVADTELDISVNGVAQLSVGNGYIDTGTVNILNGGVLRIYEATNTDFFELKTPTTPAGNYQYVFPADAPVAGDALRVTSVVGTVVTLEWAP